MENSVYILEIGGKQYRLKLTARWAEACESRLCKSLPESVEDALKTKTVAVLLWGALQANHGSTMDETYNLLDELAADGRLTLDARVMLINEILGTGGFFTPAELDAVRNALKPKKPEAKPENNPEA